MVLPAPEWFQCGEVDVGVLARPGPPAYTLNVDAHYIRRQFGDDAVTNAILGDAEDAGQSIEEPDGRDHVKPDLVNAREPRPVGALAVRLSRQSDFIDVVLTTTRSFVVL